MDREGGRAAGQLLDRPVVAGDRADAELVEERQGVDGDAGGVREVVAVLGELGPAAARPSSRRGGRCGSGARRRGGPRPLGRRGRRRARRRRCRGPAAGPRPRGGAATSARTPRVTSRRAAGTMSLRAAPFVVTSAAAIPPYILPPWKQCESASQWVAAWTAISQQVVGEDRPVRRRRGASLGSSVIRCCGFIRPELGRLRDPVAQLEAERDRLAAADRGARLEPLARVDQVRASRARPRAASDPSCRADRRAPRRARTPPRIQSGRPSYLGRLDFSAESPATLPPNRTYRE